MEVNSLIDDTFLHLKGKYAKEQAADDDNQQEKLIGTIAPGYPIK